MSMAAGTSKLHNSERSYGKGDYCCSAHPPLADGEMWSHLKLGGSCVPHRLSRVEFGLET